MENGCFFQWFPVGSQTKPVFRPFKYGYGRLSRVSHFFHGVPYSLEQRNRRKKSSYQTKLLTCSRFDKINGRRLSDVVELPKNMSPSVCRDTFLEAMKEVGGTKVGEIRRAILPREELWLERNKSPRELFKEGDELEVEVLHPRDNFDLVVSEVSVRRRKCWNRVSEFYFTSKSFPVLVLGCKNNGLIVRYDCIEGYLPIEHLIPSKTVSQVMNTELEVKVLSLEPEANNLVVSQRLTITEKREKELNVGSIVKGVVRAVRDYGVVVDLYGVLGLLFVKDISCDPVEDPSTVFSVGETIQCMIIHTDRKRHRVILSTRALELRSGEMLKDKTKVFEKKKEALKRVGKILEERSSRRKCFFGKTFPVQNIQPK
ncbi:30S ribosomal protein S1 homolog A [Galdieria sulphuraria]|nr:30S ribosomal protein S1 homolog A [Galdieria sulphuraria]